MNKKMKNTKILCCGPLPKGNVTGVGLAFELLVKGLKSSKIECSVVDATFRGDVKNSGRFSFMRSFETIVVILSVWYRLTRCNIYYATMSTSFSGFWRDYFTVFMASLLRRRIVLHLHGGGFEDFYLSQNKWMKKRIVNTLKSTTNIIVLGELLKNQFKCVGDDVYKKLTVVPNGLTLGVEEPDYVVKKLPVDADVINLLYLSSLMQSKGYIDVLRALKSLMDVSTNQKYHLHLCGSFVKAKTESDAVIFDESSLEKYLLDNKLNKLVTYHNQVLGNEKDEMFKLANIFILPTYYPWEGQPLSIIEALAYGVPVISTRHKGIPEEVIDGVNGILVNAKSPDDIIKAIGYIISDSNKYTSMSQAARIHYESNFRREVHLKNLISKITGCSDSVELVFKCI